MAAQEEYQRAQTIRRVCAYIEENLDSKLTLPVLGAYAGMSPFHLQRVFKTMLGISPREYADACRTKLLRNELQRGRGVTRAIYDAGFGSSSRVYERTNARLGMTPAAYSKGGRGVRIAYTTTGSPLGRLLVAATGRGICSVRFGDADQELERELRREFPAAEIERADTRLNRWMAAIRRRLQGTNTQSELPLDVRSTAFQKLVWNYLQTIPPGRTRSYGEVAKAIGRPKAARAVARACATNPVAVVIPCHRVIREDGDLGGYRWGLDRKRTLLSNEKTKSPGKSGSRT